MPQLTVRRLKLMTATMQDTAVVRFIDELGHETPIEDDWEFGSEGDGLMTLFEMEQPEVPKDPTHKLTAAERRLFMKSLMMVWDRFPEMRFMQLMINAIKHKHVHGDGPIPFYVEDETLIRMLEKFLEETLNHSDVTESNSSHLRTPGSGRNDGPATTDPISSHNGDPGAPGDDSPSI